VTGSWWLCGLLFLLPFVTGFGPPALIESDAARAPVTEAVLRQVAAAPTPAVRARAGVLVDGGDKVLWGRDVDARLAIASTTKIMTALVAIERGRLDQPILARIGAAQLAGSSVAGLRAGERLPLGEMLYALMLPSGNDAALAVAETLGGSVDGYVGLMNARAEQMGLRNTHFVNPHGLDATGHYSSARDLARMGSALLEAPYLAQVVASKEHQVGAYRWRNTNDLLFRRQDVSGVKTGTEDLAGQVLVASARQGDRRVIAVVLNSPDRWAEASALLDYFFKEHAAVAVALPPSPFYRGLTVRGGRSETFPLWQVRLSSAQLRLDDAGPAAGGTVDVEVAGRSIGQAALTRP
jgi:serine-type D-Ala-D-Ala carboxypeptidase (penicillin-binding protein 5/6)